jgi:hypothetical protein
MPVSVILNRQNTHQTFRDDSHDVDRDKDLGAGFSDLPDGTMKGRRIPDTITAHML